MNETPKGKERKPGWWYPWIFVAFFAVIFTVNGIMIFNAYDSWTGLETKDHYLKGLAYDENIAKTRAQEALGWDVNLTVTPVSSEGDARTVSWQASFMDRDGQPVENLKAHTYFVRPTSEGFDVDQPANLIEPGVLGGEITVQLKGQWIVRVHAISNDQTYQLVERVVVQ